MFSNRSSELFVIVTLMIVLGFIFRDTLTLFETQTVENVSIQECIQRCDKNSGIGHIEKRNTLFTCQCANGGRFILTEK